MALTYKTKNKIGGYFNDHYSLMIRAFAYSKNMKLSETVVLMCRTFMENVTEEDRKKMIVNYLLELKEVKE